MIPAMSVSTNSTLRRIEYSESMRLRIARVRRDATPLCAARGPGREAFSVCDGRAGLAESPGAAGPRSLVPATAPPTLGR